MNARLADDLNFLIYLGLGFFFSIFTEEVYRRESDDDNEPVFWLHGIRKNSWSLENEARYCKGEV